MKLLIAIINKEDEKNLLAGLEKEKLSATKLTSQGTFLKKEGLVFLIATEKEKVENIITLIKSCCTAKLENIPTPVSQSVDPGGLLIPEAETVATSGAVIFVVDLEKIIKT